MSLIADLLSKVKQADRPGKDVPPGLTNSINAYKKKETGRRRAVLFAVVALAALISGFAAVYIVKLVSGGPASEVRTPSETRVDNNAESAAAREDTAAPSASKIPAPAPQKVSAAHREREARPRAANPKKAGRSEGGKGADAAVTGTLDGLEGKGKQEAPDAAKHYYSALDYEKRGEVLKAVESYGEALKIEPRNYRLMNKIASLFMEMGMWEEAEGYLARSVGIKGDYAPALINTGIVSANLGRLQEAEGYLSRALAIEPLNRLALFNAALLYEKRGMRKEAKKYYLKLKQLGDPQGAGGLERIEGKTP
ncbi:MAG: hypothetical protein Q8P48_02405 [Deltaproteobacteria bacterium]|nr:hypothetical protein [Deltaproteobacteria bacterium]